MNPPPLLFGERKESLLLLLLLLFRGVYTILGLLSLSKGEVLIFFLAKPPKKDNKTRYTFQTLFCLYLFFLVRLRLSGKNVTCLPTPRRVGGAPAGTPAPPSRPGRTAAGGRAHPDRGRRSRRSRRTRRDRRAAGPDRGTDRGPGRTQPFDGTKKRTFLGWSCQNDR